MNSLDPKPRGIHKNLSYLPSKVNFRKYLTNKREPAELSSEESTAMANVHSGIIDDTYPRKQVFRKIARRLRIGYKI